MAANQIDECESLYQPTCINVESSRWEKFGYVLIAGSTGIMLMQAIGLGPPWIWKEADDVSTVFFTIELFVRIFEKGYLFFTENEKNWNFFDSMVVAISLFSMIMSAAAAQDASASNGHGSAANNAAMNKMKVLRTLRLLRLLRLFRVFRGIEKVSHSVDMGLNKCVVCFLAILVGIALFCIVLTFMVGIWIYCSAWLRVHQLPTLPRID